MEVRTQPATADILPPVSAQDLLPHGGLSAPPAKAARITSIDVLRGFIILTMIFVNDLASVQNVPPWMEHYRPGNGDGMTFVDVVFPAFLFIVGLSIPFAIGRRLKSGEPLLPIWGHILLRTASLLLIGVFMVNTESMDREAMVVPRAIWQFLMYAAVLLIWTAPFGRQEGAKQPVWANPNVRRALGFGTLLVLALLYEGEGQEGFIEMGTHWWGILGLIGWAYLVACFTYTLLRNNVAGLIGMSAILYVVFMADTVGYFEGWTWITSWVDIGSMLGSHAALTVSGVALGVILSPDSPIKTSAHRIRWALFYGLALGVTAHLLHSLNDVHRMFIINKPMATPAWCLWSAAITTVLWAAIYWVVDVRGWKRGTGMLQFAGQNALLAYILAPIFYASFGIVALLLSTSNPYSALSGTFPIGLTRSILFALGIVWITSMLTRSGVKLKL